MTERSVLVRIRGDVSDLNRALEAAGLKAETLGTKMQGAEAKGNALIQSITAIAPAIAPIAVQAVPVIAGMAAQFGVAATAAGVAVLAFHGVGDALKAVNTYQLTPTTANLIKMQQAMQGLGPAGRDFVHELDRLGPIFHQFQSSAQAGLFPGLTAGIKSVLTLAPQLNGIIREVAKTSGHLAAQAGAGLAGPQFRDFFNYVEATAKPLLIEMGATLGNIAVGFAHLLVAFGPLERQFSAGFLTMARSFADWAAGLDKTKGFQEFLDYVTSSGPQVLSTLEAVGHALVEIGKAIAPLGGPVLHIIQDLANAIATLANSPLGTPLLGTIVAINAFKVAMRGIGPALAAYKELAGGGSIVGGPIGRGINPILSKTQTQFSNIAGIPKNIKQGFGVTGTLGGFGALTTAELNAKYAAIDRMKSGLVGVAKAGAGIAAVTLAMSGLAEKTGLANTATLGLAGAMFGTWGAAAGIAIGSIRDFTAAQKGLGDAINFAHLAATSQDLDQKHAAQQALLAQASKLQNGSAFNASANFARVGALFGLNGGVGGLTQASRQINDSIKTQQAQTQLKLLADGFHLSAAGAKAAGQSAADFQKTMDVLNEHLARYTGVTAYHRALLDFSDALKKNGKTLNENTRAGQDNRDALAAIASSALDLASKMGTVERIKFLANARKEFINAAVEAGKTRDQAKRLADQVLGLNSVKGKVHIDADARAAYAVLNPFATFLAGLTRPRTVSVGVKVHKGSISTGGSGGLSSLLTPADGVTVPGARGVYGDRVPALLAPTEEVISNRFGQADRWRPLLKAINANQLADGGTAAQMAKYAVGRYVSQSGSGIDYNRLAAAINGDRLMAHRATRQAIAEGMRAALQGTPIVRVPANQPLPYGAV